MFRILIFLVSVVFGLIELLILLRLALGLLGANSAAPVVNWINQVSSSLIYPFQGIFPPLTILGGYEIETSAVIAPLVYAVIGYFIIHVLTYISHYSRTHVSSTKVVHED